MKILNIKQNYSPQFGQIIYDDEYVQDVAKNDFNTPKLWNKYQDIISKQKMNPVDIHLDLFLADESEIPLYPGGWYIKAIVKDKVFKQRVYCGSPIAFLRKASAYANLQNFYGKILKNFKKF